MFSALVGDKPEFVRLLLENGVCVQQFLEHEDTLCELYAHLPACFFMRKLVKRVQDGRVRRGQAPPPGSKKISLIHVSEEVRHLLGSFTQHLYALPRQKATKDDMTLSVSWFENTALTYGMWFVWLLRRTSTLLIQSFVFYGNALLSQ